MCMSMGRKQQDPPKEEPKPETPDLAKWCIPWKDDR